MSDTTTQTTKRPKRKPSDTLKITANASIYDSTGRVCMRVNADNISQVIVEVYDPEHSWLNPQGRAVIDLEELKQMAGLMGQATNELPKVPQRD